MPTKKPERRSRHLSSFSFGKRATMRTVSSSIPGKASVVDGPTVFPGAMGIPIKLHYSKEVSN